MIKVLSLPLAALLAGCQLATPIEHSHTHSESLEPTAAIAEPLPVEKTVAPQKNTKTIVIKPLPAPPRDLWERISKGYQLALPTNQQRIEQQLRWYKKHPLHLRRVSDRAKRYIYYVTEQLDQQNLPLELALLPIIESAYDPFAYSNGRASGMWQFIPSTGRAFQLEQQWWYDGRRDVIASTQAAIRYLQQLNKRFDGDWLVTLAAYNAGQGTVSRAIRKNKQQGKAIDFWSLDLPKETRSYVPKLLALANIVANPSRYNVALPSIPNRPYFAVVNTQSQLDLAQAAKMADIGMDELYKLNPGFNRWATPPNGPHRLLVPLSQRAQFQQKLSQLPIKERIHWQRYRIKPGDSLILIAKRFNTDISTIRYVNQLQSNKIRAGKTLMIPTASEQRQHYQLSAEQRVAKLQQRRPNQRRSQRVVHTVEAGDSLWKLARRYKVSVNQLTQWNSIAPRDVLKLGQQLSVWLKPDNGQGVTRKVGYKVRSGDSLARIADRFNVRISDIVKWNAVNPKKYLQPGQSLTLYIDVLNRVK